MIKLTVRGACPVCQAYFENWVWFDESGSGDVQKRVRELQPAHLKCGQGIDRVDPSAEPESRPLRRCYSRKNDGLVDER